MFKRIFSSAALLAFTLLMILGTAALPQGSGSLAEDGGTSVPLGDMDVLERVYASAVIVESGELVGSGNFLSTAGPMAAIITASHVIEDEKDISVTLPDGRKLPAAVSYRDSEKDYCLLQADCSPAACVTIADRLPSAEESVFMAAPDSYGAVTAGVVISPEVFSEDLSENVIYCRISVAEGMSGGGLFSAAGEYLGLLIGGSDSGEGAFLSSVYIDTD